MDYLPKDHPNGLDVLGQKALAGKTGGHSNGRIITAGGVMIDTHCSFPVRRATGPQP